MGRYRLAEQVADTRIGMAFIFNGPTEGETSLRVLPTADREAMAKLVPSVEHFDVTAAVDWYNADDSVSSDLTEFLPLRMPFRDLWAEFEQPVTAEELANDPFNQRTRLVGALITETPARWPVHRLYVDGGRKPFDLHPPEGADHLLLAQPMCTAGDLGLLMPHGIMLIWVTDAGAYVDSVYLSLPGEDERMDSWDRGAIRPILFALALANVKGSQMSPARVAGTPCRKKRKQKRVRLAYRVITLPGTRANGSSRPSGRAGLGLIPQHLVRGHFATYTDDAPLFGKRTGTYWRPAHVRGNPERGTTDKDYKVEF